MLSPESFKLVSGPMVTYPEEYNRMLDTFVWLRKVCVPPQPGAGLRFRLVSPGEFSKLRSRHKDLVQSRSEWCFHVDRLFGTGCKLFTHAVVSQWLIDEQELHCDQDQISLQVY
jgi:hypothetical protein